MARTLSKRVLGALIVLSIILMLVPLMLPPSYIHPVDKDAIAVDERGVKTDANGELLGLGQGGISDLLAPVDDGAAPSPDALAPSPDATPLYADHEEVLTAGPAPEVPAEPAPPAPPVAESVPDVLIADNVPPKEPAPRAEPAPKPEKPKPAAQTRPEPKPQTAQKEQARPRGGYTVQVGVFSQRKNADNIVAKLRLGGVKAYAENIKVNNKTLVRVMAGSANSRNELRGTLDKVRKLTSIEGKIVAVK